MLTVPMRESSLHLETFPRKWFMIVISTHKHIHQTRHEEKPEGNCYQALRPRSRRDIKMIDMCC